MLGRLDECLTLSSMMNNRSSRRVLGGFAILLRVASVSREHMYLGHIRFRAYPVALPGQSGIGGLISDHVLVSQSAARFDRGVRAFSLVAYMEMQSAGFIGKLF